MLPILPKINGIVDWLLKGARFRSVTQDVDGDVTDGARANQRSRSLDADQSAGQGRGRSDVIAGDVITAHRSGRRRPSGAGKHTPNPNHFRFDQP